MTPLLLLSVQAEHLISVLLLFKLGDGLEIVSGKWEKDGIMKDFTAANGYGALALSSAGTLDGTVFSFVVKGKTSSATAQNITVALTFKNGSSTVGTVSASKSVKVVCASHTYNAWSNDSTSQHKRTCTACCHTETSNHTWNGGTITKTATCKETGIKAYTCTACNATKTETIAKTNSHNRSGYQVTKQPTKSNNTIWIVIAVVAVVILGAVTAVIIIKKKKAKIAE